MRKLRPAVVALLFAVVMVPGLVAAASQGVHSIWSTKGGAAVIKGTLFAPVLNSSVVSWKEGAGPAFANARITADASGIATVLELHLVALQGLPTNDVVQGLWNVTLDGVLVCAACPGYAKGLSHPVGSPYNIDVDNSFYRLDGIITSRFDY
ncbi:MULTISPECIES: hypothetical protein [Myxococcus]|uniref:hypothetical protein n=1 Tax=Myxococcus TaxID=32 RepID=UPI0013D5FB27|nr:MULTISPECIES: hypothetical protein [Myxococcus]NVJ21285.1 hypothetical protein [Myxococcus sp. AM011]